MVCKHCGKEIEPKKVGRKNTGFCSPKCYAIWSINNKPKRHTKMCEYCGGEFQTNQTNQKYCSVACSRAVRKTGRTIHTKVCLYCGEEFKTIHKNNKYCNSTCAAQHAADLRRGEYFCEYCGKPRHSDHPNRNRFCSRECAMKARALVALLRREEKKKQSVQYRECDYCGELYLMKHSNQRFCCDDCREKCKLKEDHDMRLAAFTPIVRECKHCGDTFVTTFKGGNRLYCSEQCQKREAHEAYKETRKQQMQRAFVEPVGFKTVYRSYKGKCAICGLPVPNTTEPENPWGATVDHIIPLSKGGLHQKSNCQLAHRMCNSIKCDTEEEFKIDWVEKLVSEPGRWNAQLDELWRQLAVDLPTFT